jgi:hypothetical protein
LLLSHTAGIRCSDRKGCVSSYRNYQIAGAAVLDVRLTIEAQTQVLNVEEEAQRISVDPGLNAGALVLREKELSTLSDDPDELAQQLQAMAGPSAGPNGGQIYIDGFSGGSLPPKASIREVRINTNPYSTEFDRPGFGRIEILTRPGTDKIRGQVFGQFNDESLNSRSPLLSQSKRPHRQRSSASAYPARKTRRFPSALISNGVPLTRMPSSWRRRLTTS